MDTPTTSTKPRSPQRCLLHAARTGRERWKRKAQQRNQELKRLKVRMYELQKSRQRHAQTAQATQRELTQAQQTLDQLQHQLHQAQSQIQQLEEKNDRSR